MAKIRPPRQAVQRVGPGQRPPYAPTSAGNELAAAYKNMAINLEAAGKAASDAITTWQEAKTRGEVQKTQLAYAEWRREYMKTAHNAEPLDWGKNLDKGINTFYQSQSNKITTAPGREWLKNFIRYRKATDGQREDKAGWIEEVSRQDQRRALLETQATREAAEAWVRTVTTGDPKIDDPARSQAVENRWKLFEDELEADAAAETLFDENIPIYKQRFDAAVPVMVEDLLTKQLTTQVRDMKDMESVEFAIDSVQYATLPVEVKNKIRRAKDADIAVNKAIVLEGEKKAEIAAREAVAERVIAAEVGDKAKAPATYSNIIKFIQTDLNAPSKLKLELIDDVKQRAEAIKADRDDPYKITQNPAKEAKFWQQATSDPDKLDPADVWKTVGKKDGISLPAAKSLITELEDEASALKTPAAKSILARLDTLIEKKEMSWSEGMAKINELRQFLTANPKATPEQIEKFWETQVEPVAKKWITEAIKDYGLSAISPVGTALVVTKRFSRMRKGDTKFDVAKEPMTLDEFNAAGKAITDEDEARKYFDKWKHKWPPKQKKQ